MAKVEPPRISIEVQALRAVASHIASPADPRYEATCSAAPSAAGSPDIQLGTLLE